MRASVWVCFCLLLAGQTSFARAARSNFILITLDTTRADRMGFLGSNRGLTPNLDRLAKQGVVFSRAYSQVPLTFPSHASILTGTYPQFHQVNDFGMPLSKDLPSLPEILQKHGYKTAAFVGSAALDPKSGWVPGLDRGFDTYEASFSFQEPGDDRYQTMERRGGEVVARALLWLKSHSKRPFFLWIHLYDPHAPYEPPEPFKDRYSKQPYDGEIAYSDSALGKLFDGLRARGLFNSTLIAVMSDHGEAFGEHGEYYHGTFLYDETIHVPLLFKMPAQRFAGTRINVRAELVDVAPTILEWAGIPAPKSVQGESLLALVKSAKSGAKPVDPASDRTAYAETDYPHLNFGWSSLRALRTGKYLFVEAPRKELYDQSTDLAAEHNLAAGPTAVSQTLAERLDTFRRKTATSAKAVLVELDPRLAQQLGALGYVSGNHAAAAEDKLTGPDPKDNIEIANRLDEALLAQGDGRFEDVVRLLEPVQAKNPNIIGVARVLGQAWRQLGDYEKALPVLRKAVALSPQASFDHYRLAQALFGTGDFESARAEVQLAIARSSLADLNYVALLHFLLAAIEGKEGNTAEALKELQLAETLNPNDYATNLALGRLLTLQVGPASGLAYLQKAATLQPQAPEPHIYLADAYTKLGQEGEATGERLEAERLQALAEH